MIILCKSVKSLQLVLNELFLSEGMTTPVTSSAYTQARHKLKHTAFQELNDGIIALNYAEDKMKRWKGFRCLGVDASQIYLQSTPAIEAEFGSSSIRNKTMEGKYSTATYVCCYDVLNKLTVQNILGPGFSYEPKLAAQMLNDTETKDLMIFDRGYMSYEFLALLMQAKKYFVIRCPKNSFKVAQSLFDQEDDSWQKVVTLNAPRDRVNEVRNRGLPLEMSVRFVSVVLSTGEIEVLVTNLIDLELEREEFKDLYHLRWGVECYFQVLKSRLSLENFTGKSVESVYQDFWSTIFISNVESIVTADVEGEINTRNDRLEKKVNKAVSFNALKNMAFEIFFTSSDLEASLNKLTLLFKTNTIVRRPERNAERKTFSALKSYRFARCLKKNVF